MRTVLGTISLLCLSLASLAQAPAQSTSSAVVLQAPTTAACPVGFEARHAQDGGLVSVSPAFRRREQGYRLTFWPGEGHAIAQARITLHGLSGAQVLPAGESSRADATESFNVAPSATAKHLFHSTVYTEKLTGVQSVELNEITYADGTIWRQSATATCRVTPNGFMLVAGTR